MFNKDKKKKEIRTTAEAGLAKQEASFSVTSEKQEVFLKSKSQAWELFLKEQQIQCDMEIERSPLGTSSENDESILLETVVPVEVSGEPAAYCAEAVVKTSSELSLAERETAMPAKSTAKRKKQLSVFPKKQDSLPGNKGQSATEKNKRVLLVCIVLCAVIVAGSAYFIHWRLAADRAAIDAIVEQRMAELSADNTAALADINTRLTTIEGQMTEIEDILEITDQSISSSSSANREAMAKQIQELDKQMAKLKESINLLLESKAK